MGRGNAILLESTPSHASCLHPVSGRRLHGMDGLAAGTGENVPAKRPTTCPGAVSGVHYPEVPCTGCLMPGSGTSRSIRSQGCVGRYSLGRLFQCLLDILYAMVARVTLKIKRPLRSVFPATKPFFGCILKGSEYISLNLPMPR